ncbi:MAG: hypothetical protein K6A41_04595 [Bacteroidales bacterium]|nr:hypothetical protein [Bacteroidales bacterium]
MGIIHIDGRMTVKQLADEFYRDFACTLRVYKNPNATRIADDNERLGNIRIYNAPGSCDISVRPNITVGAFCERMKEEAGLVVRVASPDNWVLANENLTLSMVKTLRSQTTKKDMDEILQSVQKEIQNVDLDTTIKELQRNKSLILKQSKEISEEDIDSLSNAMSELSESSKKGRLKETINDWLQNNKTVLVAGVAGILVAASTIAGLSPIVIAGITATSACANIISTLIKNGN